mmetsp:Transcript_22140/g.29133  ORF Transcript_22140/g.29133 Transcript_22140/m.29133 type:complete len:258 (+) Transcript_22140:101-874(+)
MTTTTTTRILRDIVGLPHLSPLWNNVCSSLLTVVYMKICLEISFHFRIRWHTSQKARRFAHISDAFIIMFWPLFDTHHWSWRLNVLVPVVMAVRIFYKGAILRNPDDEDVRIMSHSSSPSELLYGPLQYKILVIVVGLYRFMSPEGAIIVAAVGIGDGLAPAVGQNYGRHIYQMPLSNAKTLEGSVTVFMGTVVGIYLYFYMLGLTPILPLRMTLAYGAVAACVEGSTPGMLDNIVVPLALHFSIERVKEWEWMLPP